MPKDRLDREKREKYEIVIKSSEYCECVDENIYLKQNQSKNPCYFVSNETLDFNDISLLKVKVIIQDINDNKPKFLKSYYQIGVTSDIEYGDIILDSYVIYIYFFDKTGINKKLIFFCLFRLLTLTQPVV